MCKVWSEDPDSDYYTRAANLTLASNPNGYWEIMSGISLAGHFPDTTMEIQSENPPADHFVVGGVFVISEGVVQIFNEFKVQAEYFQLRIIYKGQEYTDRRFFFCNILDKIECFDFKRGKCTMSNKPGFTDRIKTIKKLAIEESKAASYPLFRLAKCSPVIVGASDSLSHRIVECAFNGIRLIDPEKWKFGV